MNQKLKAIIIIAVVATLLTAGLVAAAYMMTAPNSDPVTVTLTPSQATLSKVTVDKTTMIAGEYLTITTTVSDSTSGILVKFYNSQEAQVGAGLTNTAGTASVTFQPAEGTWTFYATAEHP